MVQDLFGRILHDMMVTYMTIHDNCIVSEACTSGPLPGSSDLALVAINQSRHKRDNITLEKLISLVGSSCAQVLVLRRKDTQALIPSSAPSD